MSHHLRDMLRWGTCRLRRFEYWRHLPGGHLLGGALSEELLPRGISFRSRCSGYGDAEQGVCVAVSPSVRPFWVLSPFRGQTVEVAGCSFEAEFA